MAEESSVKIKEPIAKPIVVEQNNRKNYNFELNWYDFETGTRKLVFELLQPSVTRITEDREVLFQIQRTV
jgi:hypothetical protein